MHKKDLAAHLALKHDISKTAALAFVDGVFDVIADTLASGEEES